MPFFVFLPVAILVEELVQVVAAAVVVGVGVTATVQATQTTVSAVHRGVEAICDLNTSSSTSTRTTCFEELGKRTIVDWWEKGRITAEEKQILLGHGYEERTGCFDLRELRDVLDDFCFEKTKEKAPGKPTEKDGYEPGKVGKEKENLVKNPNGSGKGWLDKNGEVWVPSGDDGHGGAHWDVQNPRTGGHRDVLPGGKVRHAH